VGGGCGGGGGWGGRLVVNTLITSHWSKYSSAEDKIRKERGREGGRETGLSKIMPTCASLRQKCDSCPLESQSHYVRFL